MKTFPIAIMALVLELLFWQLTQVNVRSDVPLAIRLMMLAFSVYLVSAIYVRRRKTLTSKVFILAAAAVFRLTLAPLAPSLSNDVYRYRWEGRVQTEGLSPYMVAPATSVRDATFARIPTPDARSGYGPVASLTEWASFELARRITDDPARQAFWMKLPSVAFEAATLVVLAPVLTPGALLLYAWSPLPVVEFWWNGHNDAMAVFFLVAAMLLATAQRPGTAATASHVALGLAIAVKWWPAVLWPLFVWRDRGRTWLIAPAVVAASSLPYVWTPEWRELIANARYMSGFVGGWRNNDSLFGVLLWAAGGDQYAAKYAAFALLAAFVAWMALRRWPLERAALSAVAAMLLLSANCHPWYLTWLLPLALFAPAPWWPLPVLVWQALMPLAYIVLEGWQARGEWVGSRPDRWWIYLPVFTSMAVSAWCYRRQQQQQQRRWPGPSPERR